tara:strand:+ start:1600 stop:2628 length:1029 start_codon:yes stop_codon:yes gene_type:complete
MVANHYKFLLQEYSSIKNLSVVACCDLNPKLVKDFSKSFDANPYDDLEDMLTKEDLDILLILTPSGLHFDHASKALDKNVSVVIEKPICLIPEQAFELNDKAKSKNLFVSSVFQNRYNPSIKKLKSFMDDGKFGKLVSASVRLRWCRKQEYYQDNWHGTWKMDGGVICQQAIHHLDALNWILGPAKSVCAEMGNQVNELEAEDTMVGIIKFESGCLATIEVTTAARPRDFEASISIVGEKGIAQVGGIALNKVDVWDFIDSNESIEEVSQLCDIEVPNGMGFGHLDYLNDLITCLSSDGAKIPMEVPESTNALELVHALYSSVEQGGWINLDDKNRSKFLGK